MGIRNTENTHSGRNMSQCDTERVRERERETVHIRRKITHSIHSYGSRMKKRENELETDSNA